MFGLSVSAAILWLLEHIPIFLVHGVILLGIIAFLIGRFTPLIPDKLLLKIAGIAIFCFGVLLEGATFGVDLYKPQWEKAQAEVTAINAKAPIITEKIVTQYRDRIKIIKEKGDEIPTYVTIKNDVDCSLHVSTIVLLNAASENSIPDPTGRVDESPSGVALSTLTKSVAENYTTYNEVAQQLRSLQNWVKEQKANNDNNGK